MNFDIEKLEQYREGNRLEAKRAEGGIPHSLWETYSAMANSYGGVILLGVTERGDGTFELSGLKDAERIKKDFWNTLNNPQKVSLNLLTEKNVREYDVDGKMILAITVPRAKREDRPVYINNDLFKGTYRRNGEGDYRCSKSEIRAMLRDETEDTMDMKVIAELEIKDLSIETLHSYRNRHMAIHADHVWEKLGDEEYLERIGGAGISNEDGRLHPTGAGLLMFGEEYKIVREYPEYFLDFRELLDPSIRWTDRLISSSGEWTGNLFDFFFRVVPKLTRDLKVPFRLDGITRVDDTPAHKAIREAFANCLVNADFYLPRGVVIRKDAEKIVFENPGSIRTGKAQMLKGGVSDPRNKALMKMFNMINIGERAGSGVPGILSVWEAQGWAEPRVEEQYGPDRTILTLPLSADSAEKNGRKTAENRRKNGDKSAKNQQKIGDKSAKSQAEQIAEFQSKAAGRVSEGGYEIGEKTAIKGGDKSAINLSDRKKQIITTMRKGEKYSMIEIAAALGLKESRTRQILKELVDDQFIVAVGKNKGRRYRLPE